MNEYLIIRLSNQTNTKLIWWIWSPSGQKVIRQGALASLEDLDSLGDECVERKVILLVSAADVSLKSVSLPTTRIRHLDKVVPYLVEDEFSVDVEDLHFTILNRIGQSVFFAALDRHWLGSLIARFSELGVTIDKVLPDVLALPNEGVSLVKVDDDWLIRQSAYQGVVVEDSWLAYYMNQLAEPPVDESGETPDAVATPPVSQLAEDADVPLIKVYSELPDSISQQTHHWQPCYQESPLPLLSAGALSHSVNLLSGEFRAKSSLTISWGVWKKCAIAFVVMLCVGLTYHLVNATMLEKQAKALHAENERIFHQIFPDKKKIPTTGYLKRQFDSELARLNGGNSQTSVIKMFDMIASAIGSQNDIQIQTFSFDAAKGQLRLDLQGKSFSSFEVARKSLEGAFHVDQGPLNKSDNAVQGTYTLRQR